MSTFSAILAGPKKADAILTKLSQQGGLTDSAVVLIQEARAALEPIPALVADLEKLTEAGTDLVLDVDKIAKALPGQSEEVVHAVLAIVNHFTRVGTQASRAAQEARQMVAEVTGFVADIRRNGLHLSFPGD